VVIALISFLGGNQIARIVYERLAPYSVFDKEAVKTQNIHVVENQRHRVFFSNAPEQAIPKSELKGLGFLCGVLWFVLSIAFFFGLIFVAAKLIGTLDKALAEEVQKILRRNNADYMTKAR
jgi:hypothetical protein